MFNFSVCVFVVFLLHRSPIDVIIRASVYKITTFFFLTEEAIVQVSEEKCLVSVPIYVINVWLKVYN